MQIPKAFFICTLGLTFVPVFTQAAETDAQIRAREEVRRKIAELEGKTSPAESAAPVKPKPAERPAQKPAAAQLGQNTASQIDSEALRKAREQLEQKMREIEAQQSPAPAPAPVQVAPARVPPRVAPVAPAVTQPKPAPVVSAPVAEPEPDLELIPPVDDASIAKAREMVRQKIAEMDGEQPSAPVVHAPAQPVPRARSFEPTPGFTAAPEPARPVREARTRQRTEAERHAVRQSEIRSAYQPIESPTLSISATKAERLAELLRRYKADEITPSEYHSQRAKIIAEE